MTELDQLRASLESEFGTPLDPPVPLDEWKAEAATARASDGGLKSLATPVRRGVLLALAVGVPLLCAGLLPRPDLAVVPLGRLVGVGGLHLAAVIGASWAALASLDRLAAGRRTVSWMMPAVLGGLVLMLALGPAHLDHPASVMGGGEDFGPKAVTCFIGGLFVAIFPFIGQRLLDRSDAAWLGDGLMLGALGAGVAGNLYLLLHCPIVWPSHIAAGHLSVVAFLLLIGGLLKRLD